MEFYQQAGPMAIGSRLRRLSDLVTEDAGLIYQFYKVPLEPKWFPVFYLLGLEEELSVTQIARQIGHTHPSVSQIVKEMKKAGLVKTKRSKTDARMHLVHLTDQGRQVWGQLKRQAEDVGAAVEALLVETTHNLWAAMNEFEALLMERNLFARVVEQFKARESNDAGRLDEQPVAGMGGK